MPLGAGRKEIKIIFPETVFSEKSLSAAKCAGVSDSARRYEQRTTIVLLASCGAAQAAAAPCLKWRLPVHTT